MKQIKTLVTAAAFVLCFSACGSNQISGTTTDSSSTLGADSGMQGTGTGMGGDSTMGTDTSGMSGGRSSGMMDSSNSGSTGGSAQGDSSQR